MNSESIQADLALRHEYQRDTIAPTRYLGIQRNYQYDFSKLKGDKLEAIELFVSFEYFIRGAKGFGQLNYREYPNLAPYYKLFFQYIGRLADLARKALYSVSLTMEYIPRRAGSSRPVLHTVDASEFQYYQLFEEIQQQDWQNEYLGFRIRLAVNFELKDEIGRSIVYASPHGTMDNQNQFNLFNLGGDDNNNNNNNNNKGPGTAISTTLGEFTLEIISTNCKRKEKQNKRVYQNQAPPLEIDEMELDGFRKMVVALKGLNVNPDDTTSNCVSINSVWNPMNAFAPLSKEDYKKILLCGGDEKCLNGDDYEQGSGAERVLVFPYPENTFRITITSFRPEDICNRYFAHIAAPVHAFNAEKHAYVQERLAHNEIFNSMSDDSFSQIRPGLPSRRTNREHQLQQQLQQHQPPMQQQTLEESFKNCNIDPDRDREEEDSQAESESEAESELKQTPPEPQSKPQPKSTPPPPAAATIAKEYFLGAGLSEKEAEKIYNQVVMQKHSAAIPIYDIVEFEKESTKLYAEQVSIHPEKLRDGEYNPKWLEARKRFLVTRFIHFERSIFHEDACLPDSVKALCIWNRKHLYNDDKTPRYRNYSMPTPKQTSNLTPFGDMMVGRLSQLETAGEVFTTHQHILTIIMAALQIFFDTAFHAHVFLAGPPRTGKSHTIKKGAKNLVPGTYRFLSYMSAKAKTGAAYNSPLEFTQLLELYEEIMPSAIGVGTQDSDEVTMLKNLLTSGELTYSVLVLTTDGQRKMETRTIKVNNLFVIATNAYFSQICPAIISRFICVTYQNDERSDRGGAVGKLASASNAVRAKMEELAQYRWNRDQYFAAKIAYFLKGMSCMLHLSTDCAQAIYALVAERASNQPYCLRGFNDVRKMEQLVYFSQSAGIVDGCHTFLDSEISPVKDLDWHPCFFLELIPYCRTTIQHAVFSLGLIEHQFEDEIASNVVNTLKAVAFTETAHPANNNNNNSGPITGDQDLSRHPAPLQLEETIADEVFHRVSESLSLFGNDKEARRIAITPKQSGVKGPSRPLQAYTPGKKIRDDGYYIVVSFSAIGLGNANTKQHNSTGGFSNNSGGGGGGGDNKQILHKLATVLSHSMMPRPQHGDIVAALEELNSQVSDEVEVVEMDGLGGTRTVIKKLPLFCIDTVQQELRLFKSYGEAILNGNKRKLRKCVEEVLCHPYAREQTLIYASPYGGKYPNLFDVVHIKPNPRGRELALINTNYFNNKVKQATIDSLQGVTKNMVNSPIPFEFDDMFAKTRSYCIDMDLDEFYNGQFLNKLGFTVESMPIYLTKDGTKELPQTDPLIIQERIDALRKTPETCVYPDQYQIMSSSFEPGQQHSNNYMQSITAIANENRKRFYGLTLEQRAAIPVQQEKRVKQVHNVIIEEDDDELEEKYNEPTIITKSTWNLFPDSEEQYAENKQAEDHHNNNTIDLFSGFEEF